jgi:hypothetical protein
MEDLASSHPDEPAQGLCVSPSGWRGTGSSRRQGQHVRLVHLAFLGVDEGLNMAPVLAPRGGTGPRRAVQRRKLSASARPAMSHPTRGDSPRRTGKENSRCCGLRGSSRIIPQIREAILPRCEGDGALAMCESAWLKRLGLGNALEGAGGLTEHRGRKKECGADIRRRENNKKQRMEKKIKRNRRRCYLERGLLVGDSFIRRGWYESMGT